MNAVVSVSAKNDVIAVAGINHIITRSAEDEIALLAAVTQVVSVAGQNQAGIQSFDEVIICRADKQAGASDDAAEWRVVAMAGAFENLRSRALPGTPRRCDRWRRFDDQSIQLAFDRRGLGFDGISDALQTGGHGIEGGFEGRAIVFDLLAEGLGGGGEVGSGRFEGPAVVLKGVGDGQEYGVHFELHIGAPRIEIGADHLFELAALGLEGIRFGLDDV